MVTIRPATPADEAAVAALLRESALVPLGEFAEQYAVAVEAAGAVAGVAGVEVYAGDGLLRSVAVAADRRSQGLGAKLVQDRIAWARARRLRALYLLTTTAESYFARLGFARIAREDAPPAVAASHEWAAACPASSAAMRMLLLLLLLAGPACACFCSRSPSVKDAWTDSPLIFVGHVERAQPARLEKVEYREQPP